MTASLIFVCLFALVGLAGAPGYVGISWVFAWLGLFLTVTVLLLLMPGRRRPETFTPRSPPELMWPKLARRSPGYRTAPAPVAPQQLKT